MGQGDPNLFPNPTDLTSTAVLDEQQCHHLAHQEQHNQLDAHEAAQLDRLRKTADEKNLQAQCAGFITAAVTYVSGLALRSRSLVPYCQSAKAERDECAKTITGLLADISYITYYATSAAGVCGQPDKRSPCGASLSELLATTFTIAELGAKMDGACPDKTFWCGNFLATIGGNVPQWAGDISAAARVCVPGNGPKPDPHPKLDYGFCVSYAISAVTYIAASVLEFGGQWSECPDLSVECVPPSDPLNSLSIAAGQGVNAGGYCGGTDQSCGVDITRIFASLFDFMNGIVLSAKYCSSVTTGQGITENQTYCAGSTATVVKAAAVMAEYGSKAGVHCQPHVREDNAQCGAAVSGVLATFALLTSTISKSVYNCYDMDFKCAVWFESIAGLANVLATRLGAAQQFCPFTADPNVFDASLRHRSKPIPANIKLQFYQPSARAAR